MPSFVPGSRQRYDQYRVSVIFTEADETADSYIERSVAEMNTVQNLVEVATVTWMNSGPSFLKELYVFQRVSWKSVLIPLSRI